METTHYLIIGNSASAINAVEAIRTRDKERDLLLLSDEPYHTYSRPLITYYLGGKLPQEKLSYRPPSFYKTNNIRTLLGTEVTALDTVSKTVTLKNDTNVRFEKLLLATGGAPVIPPIPGKDLQGIFTFTTLLDAIRVKRYIEKHNVKKTVVIGGGLIGLKTTEALLALKIKVTIIELSDRILSATFDLNASGMVQDALQDTGCSTITCNTVEAFYEGDKNRIGGVILRDGMKIPCDLAILAIGVKPRLDLLKQTGIKTNKGIMVNESLMTSIKDIYAAGDVTEAYDFITGINRPIAILPNASRQGGIAGCNMAGGTRRFKGGCAMNSVELAGVPTISVGLTDPLLLPDEKRKRGVEVFQEYNKSERTYKKIILEDKRIIGAVFVGAIDRAGIYTGLIKDKADISSFKGHLLKNDFGLICLPQEYRKHLVKGQGIEV